MTTYTQLTQEILDIMCDALSKNYSRQSACVIAKITPHAFSKWIQAGERICTQLDEEELTWDELTPGEQIVVTLYTGVLSAESVAENKLVDCIVDASPDDWRAADSLLKSRHKWGVTQRVVHETPIEINNNIMNLRGLTADELNQLEQLAMKANSLPAPEPPKLVINIDDDGDDDDDTH